MLHHPSKRKDGSDRDSQREDHDRKGDAAPKLKSSEKTVSARAQVVAADTITHEESGLHKTLPASAPLLPLDPVVDPSTGRRARRIPRSAELDYSRTAVEVLVRKINK